MSLTESERRAAIAAGAANSAIRAAVTSALIGLRAVVIVGEVRDALRIAKDLWPDYVKRVTHSQGYGVVTFQSGGQVKLLTRRTLHTDIRGQRVDILLEDEL